MSDNQIFAKKQITGRVKQKALCLIFNNVSHFYTVLHHQNMEFGLYALKLTIKYLSLRLHKKEIIKAEIHKKDPINFHTTIKFCTKST